MDDISEARARVERLVAQGLTTPAIAHQLHLSTRTIESHIEWLLRHRNVPTRTVIAVQWQQREMLQKLEKIQSGDIEAGLAEIIQQLRRELC